MRGGSKIKNVKLVLDAQYRDPQITKLINKLMWDGKKSKATAIVYSALERLAKENNTDPATLLNNIVNIASPLLEVRSRRVGGATYQVPVEIKPNRKFVLVVRWILEACRKRQGKGMAEKLYEEMKAILEKTGPVMKKREDLHKMAEANRAFAHFARY